MIEKRFLSWVIIDMSYHLDDLCALIAKRASEASDSSYTAKLLASGLSKIAQKLGEEAVETVIAAVSGSRDELVSETADLIYHLMVLLQAKGVALQDVLTELQRRTQQSGLAEKAARSST
jgi:phosphoribosyl-ATP pyrophosphohydrolase